MYRLFCGNHAASELYLDQGQKLIRRQ